MITKAFSIFDSKACAFGVPFFMPTAGAAIREFSDLCRDPQTRICKHAGDYVLYEIGAFDDHTAILTVTSPHLHLGVGSEFSVSTEKDMVRDVLRNPLATVEELNGGK